MKVNGHTTKVEEVYRNGIGQIYARRISFGDGIHVTVGTKKNDVRAASLEFWDNPESFGAERVFCRGHGPSRVCPYGQHDYVRFDLYPHN